MLLCRTCQLVICTVQSAVIANIGTTVLKVQLKQSKMALSSVPSSNA